MLAPAGEAAESQAGGVWGARCPGPPQAPNCEDAGGTPMSVQGGCGECHVSQALRMLISGAVVGKEGGADPGGGPGPVGGGSFQI